MQYIRTKDGIIDLNRIHLDGSPIYNLDTKENVIKAKENREERDCYYIENDTIYGYWYLDGCIWEEHIIKQSDNLADLFDEVVLIDKKHKKPKWLLDKPKDIANFNELPTIYKNRVNKGTFIFKFGIWTDKGFTYMANMDSGGKLVLI